MAAKDEEIERLKDEMADRTQKLQTQIYSLLTMQKKNTKKVPPPKVTKPNFQTRKDRSVSKITAPPGISRHASLSNLASLQLAPSPTPSPKVQSINDVPSIEPISYQLSDEDTLLAQHHYLKMATKRLMNRRLCITNTK